ncbi:Acetyltransferase (GNAT) family protein [Bacillus sp. THAF10]|uniref:GNAT family N-acetyltransferase n=1 Tax=Bacillus sp. THAF10 TaxID=2587848 RepID=UPI0012A99178|nr:GNAT family N-acetyltransferase [Bacillus sp. THAF10]QFT88649.1 Acetyltransferase (GNAT) family protein [Bacillus sp. THAF10]
MITFIQSQQSLLQIEVDIMNSQPAYNALSSGKETLSRYDILKEQKEEKLDKERYVIRWEENYVGIIDFTMKNPKDGNPWLGLFIIHSDWERRGLAKKAYDHYESMMKSRNVKTIRLGCLEENKKGLLYWKKLGFEKVRKVFYREKPLFIMEKEL